MSFARGLTHAAVLLSVIALTALVGCESGDDNARGPACASARDCAPTEGCCGVLSKGEQVVTSYCATTESCRSTQPSTYSAWLCTEDVDCRVVPFESGCSAPDTPVRKCVPR